MSVTLYFEIDRKNISIVYNLSIEERKSILLHSKNSEYLHQFIFSKFDLLGYSNTISLIKNVKDLPESQMKYIRTRVHGNKLLIPHVSELAKIIISENWYQKLLLWSNKKVISGLTKKSLYSILSEFFIYIRFGPIDDNEDILYDRITDILDDFNYSKIEFNGIKDRC